MSSAGEVRRHPRLRALIALALVAAIAGTGAIATNTFGAGDRWERVVARVALFLDPPPDRDTRATVDATPRPRSALAGAASPAPVVTAGPSNAPDDARTAAPIASPLGSAGSATAATDAPTPNPTARPTAKPTAEPTPTPPPAREPVKVSITEDPEAVFAHEIEKDWCAVAGTQMVLAMLGLGDTSERFQREIAGRIDEWESWDDSHDGNWGPAAMAEALAAYGEPGYEIRAYRTREDALLDAAIAISETQKPVVLLTWRGAHTWVMTGYRADADPLVFADAQITHAQILDPWYPWVSSIWGPSDPPGHFENMAEMKRNYLPWERPEGRYPGRDGRFIALVPTTPR